MTGADKTPDLWERFRSEIYRRFGLKGLVALVVLGAALTLWTQWDSIRAWPGVSQVVERLTREAVPSADPQRFSVLVAHLENDTSRDHERLLVVLLKDFHAVQILRLDRIIPVEGAIRSAWSRRGTMRLGLF